MWEQQLVDLSVVGMAENSANYLAELSVVQ